MTAIVAADVTITLVKQRIMRGSPGGLRINTVKVAFGNATLTYPSGGVPMPTYPSFGLMKELEFLQMFDDSSAVGTLWKWDYVNKKLRGYIQGTVISAAGAATLDDYLLDGTTDPYAAAAVQPSAGAIGLGLVNTAAAGQIYLGKFPELSTAHAPVATTIYGLAYGW